MTTTIVVNTETIESGDCQKLMLEVKDYLDKTNERKKTTFNENL